MSQDGLGWQSVPVFWWIIRHPADLKWGMICWEKTASFWVLQLPGLWIVYCSHVHPNCLTSFQHGSFKSQLHNICCWITLIAVDCQSSSVNSISYGPILIVVIDWSPESSEWLCILYTFYRSISELVGLLYMHLTYLRCLKKRHNYRSMPHMNQATLPQESSDEGLHVGRWA